MRGAERVQGMSKGLSRRGFLAAGAGIAGAGLLRPARGADPVRLAGVYAGPLCDPWVAAVHRAAVSAAAAGEVHYVWSDRVGATDIGAALHHAATAGAALIVADVFGAEQAARAVAAVHPGTAFLLGSSFVPDAAAPNVAVFDARIDEACLLSGIIGGAVTRTGRIGMVAGYPLCGVNRRLHAFAAGARMARPGVVLETGFTGTWQGGAVEAGFVAGMLSRGADVVFGERPGAIAEAVVRGSVAMGCIGDMAGAGGAVATAAVWKVGPTLTAVLARVREGRFGPEDFGRCATMAEGGCGLAPFHAGIRQVDERASALLQRVAMRMRAGAFDLRIADHQPDEVFA